MEMSDPRIQLSGKESTIRLIIRHSESSCGSITILVRTPGFQPRDKNSTIFLIISENELLDEPVAIPVRKLKT